MQRKNHIHLRTRLIAGSALNTAREEKPPQAPPAPLAEVERQADFLATLLQHRKSRRNPVSAREQFALTRREIVALLDDPRIATALDEDERRQYHQLAAGNISEKELWRDILTRQGIPAPETALEEAEEANEVRAYIEDLENRTIERAQFCGKRFATQKRVETNTFDRTRGEDSAAQDRDIAASGGEAIGGSIIGGEKRFGNKPGTTFRPPKGITSFEKSGKIRWMPGGTEDHDRTGSEVSESDDYGEDSSA